MQDRQSFSLLFLILTLITLFVLYRVYSALQFRRRLTQERSRSREEIPSDKIIIAIQPNEVFFRVSSNYISGWNEVILPNEGLQGFWGGIGKLFKRRMYFQFKYHKKEIGNFMQLLSQNSKIQLYLYTALPLDVAELILRRCDVLQYFPEPFRHSYSKSSTEVKHAVQVDANTNRVIILTGSKRDYEEEDSKYFLVVRRRDQNLSKTVRELSKLVNRNENIDQLHNQLGILKVNFESESEGVS